MKIWRLIKLPRALKKFGRFSKTAKFKTYQGVFSKRLPNEILRSFSNYDERRQVMPHVRTQNVVGEGLKKLDAREGGRRVPPLFRCDGKK